MMQPKSSLQLTLFQAENEADRYIEYTMVEQANSLARMLAKKDLPMFYFTEAGEELGVPPKTCRSWKINTWPTVNRAGDDRLIHKVAIYIRVYMRLKEYPKEETYNGATKRLQRRVAELKEKNFSHNRISQQLRISFRTLNDIMNKEPEEAVRRNNCPWALLEKLEDAETTMQKQHEIQEKLQENQILRVGHKQRETRLDPGPPNDRNLIGKDDSCPKCGAPQNNLRNDGKDAWGRTVMSCLICGSENPAIAEETEAEDQEEANEETPDRKEFVERYSPCQQCGTPWHNLKRDRVDRWRNTVYICLRCTGINRVKAKPQRAKIT